MAHEALLETLLKGYEEGTLRGFFTNLTNYISADEEESWGALRDPDRGETPILVRSVADAERHRTAFKELGELLAKNHASAGVVLLHDKEGNYRLGYIELLYQGRRKPRPLGRSVLVRKGAPNKTARQRLQILAQKAEDFQPVTLEDFREALSVEAVTEAFYQEFVRVFEGDLVPGVRGVPEERKRDFVLAFVARTLFVAFVAKRGWLGGREDFLPWLFRRYRQEGGEGGNFYRDWLKPLFFQAFRTPPGRKPNAFAHLPPDVREVYEGAPYLNGELFREKEGLDLPEAFLTDEAVGRFYDFLFAYNFTVEENTAYEADLELNPELLGLILERLVNTVGVEGKASELGAHYTPRMEVDLMCRLALAELLHRHGLPLNKAYALLEGDSEALSPEEQEKARSVLLEAKVLDPAAGSGAFLVGILQVLEEVLGLLGEGRTLERKKRLLQNLHGVDILSWAIWMAELRLWLAYFLELGDFHRHSEEPLLPSLGLKVVQGDSVVQTVGKRSVPVRLDLKPDLLKDRVVQEALRDLLETKEGYFYNRGLTEREVRRAEKRFLLAVLDRIHGQGQTGLGLGIKTEVDQYLEERETLEQVLAKENRPFLYLVDFAEVMVARGGFDVVIGNPPYVRHEEIQDILGRWPKDDYKAMLQRESQRDVETLLRVAGPAEGDFFQTWSTSPPKSSDLYVYFYTRGLTLLNPRGVHVFVTSSAWLDTQYGTWLQRFFLRSIPLRYVIEDRAQRSFGAQVNTVITVAWAPGGNAPSDDDRVLFVAIKAPPGTSMLLSALAKELS